MESVRQLEPTVNGASVPNLGKRHGHLLKAQAQIRLAVFQQRRKPSYIQQIRMPDPRSMPPAEEWAIKCEIKCDYPNAKQRRDYLLLVHFRPPRVLRSVPAGERGIPATLRRKSLRK